MAALNFDAATVAPQEAFEVLPAAWYAAMITASEMKATKDGNGQYLEMEFTIVEGQYAKRKQFARLNLQNANPMAVEIAYKQLSTICHAVGMLRIQDSAELHGKPLMIKLKIEQREGFEARNEISNYKAYAQQAAAAPAFSAPPAFAPPVVQAPAPAAPVMPAAQPWSAPAPVAPAAPVASAPPGWTQDASGAWVPPAAAPVAPQPAPAPEGFKPPWQQ